MISSQATAVAPRSDSTPGTADDEGDTMRPSTPGPGSTRRYPARILGTGCYLPRRVVLSSELDAAHGRPTGTTEARSGVQQRRWADESETASRMGAAALGSALHAAGMRATDLSAVIVSAVAPQQPMPTTAVLVLRELGVHQRGAEAFDVNASCLGFLTAFELATLGVAAGRWDTVGIVASEVTSKGLNHADIESSALFGDGAAAAVVSRAGDGHDSTVLALRFETWSEGAELCEIPAGGTRWNVTTPPPDPTDYLFRMNGLGVMKLAARTLPPFLAAVLDDAGLALDEIDMVVPHQASSLGLRFLRERIGVPAEKVIDLLAVNGNQVSASIPSALHAAVSSGRLRRGGHALLLGTGAGYSMGAAVVRF